MDLSLLDALNLPNSFSNAELIRPNGSIAYVVSKNQDPTRKDLKEFSEYIDEPTFAPVIKGDSVKDIAELNFGFGAVAGGFVIGSLASLLGITAAWRDNDKYREEVAKLVARILILENEKNELKNNTKSLSNEEEELLASLISKYINNEKDKIQNDYDGYDSYFMRYDNAITKEKDNAEKVKLLKKMLFLPEESSDKTVKDSLKLYLGFFKLANERNGTNGVEIPSNTLEGLSNSIKYLQNIFQETKNILK